MKIFLIGLMGLLFSTFGFAQDSMVGTWIWVAAGCRDSSLSASSHITKSKKNNPFQITATELTLNEDKSASINMETNTRSANVTGTYTVKNNRVEVIDPKKPEKELLLMNVVDGELLIAFSTLRENEREKRGGDFDEKYIQLNEDICGSNQTYVYIFSNVGS